MSSSVSALAFGGGGGVLRGSGMPSADAPPPALGTLSCHTCPTTSHFSQDHHRSAQDITGERRRRDGTCSRRFFQKSAADSSGAPTPRSGALPSASRPSPGGGLLPRCACRVSCQSRHHRPIENITGQSRTSQVSHETQPKPSSPQPSTLNHVPSTPSLPLSHNLPLVE